MAFSINIRDEDRKGQILRDIIFSLCHNFNNNDRLKLVVA